MKESFEALNHQKITKMKKTPSSVGNVLHQQSFKRTLSSRESSSSSLSSSSSSSSSSLSSSSLSSNFANNIDNSFVYQENINPDERAATLSPIHHISTYVKSMAMIRQVAKQNKLVPLYHYTSPQVASLILKGGLRMSTQGQGDGGVYVSTQGPASYG
eukprot:CAMPEP_0114393062 /NCGR_PEP_ID=MMETSP0102-20121206/11246_1 /TAXON_ID=38822 ORGANISM="Pteridomonas danica, Strain PT" /NCGR_SAMPLE_ID=MMETSP0102 /ASSEMBLY_ACC=CAM_ASM_000212 /LENGTH=157 /DNA_ID=CAMNT_0001552513 /DNA_START=1859 /DNA_END=2328 /DNA_ORIENTATION=+